jgi:exodeoxyribonuclease VII large subunit
MADSNMQGPQTENSVLQALSVLEKLDIELVVIIRGGGSKTDLFSLDNEKIARAIASCKLPVWIGIGHEIDTSVLDYVGNRSFKTQTAVSEELVARFVEMDRHLNEYRNRLKSTWDYRFEGERAWVSEAKTGIREGTRKLIDILKSDLKSKANQLAVKVNTRLATEKGMISVSKSRTVSLPKARINSEKVHLKTQQASFQLGKIQQRTTQEKKNVFDRKEQLLRFFNVCTNNYKRDIGYFKYRLNKDKILARLKNERLTIKVKKSTLKAYDPKTSLKRGFSLIYNKAGKLLKSVSEISQDETITTELSDGKLTSIIETIEVKKNG